LIRLCLFDLDQTLVDSEDIEQLRVAGLNRLDEAYMEEVKGAIRARNRHIVAQDTLQSLLQAQPGMKLGIFTRSPRRYVDAVLAEAYPEIKWDVVIAYEDVTQHKPNGEGVYRAMRAVGMPNTSDLPSVLLIGDGDVDVRAAYHAGCYVALFKQGWPNRRSQSHWRSLEKLPDMAMQSQDELLACVAAPLKGMPDLECLLEDAGQAPERPRFDEIGKFFPNDRTRHVVYAAGRNFAQYDTLKRRRDCHRLSQSIQEHKDAESFPHEWVLSIQRFIVERHKPHKANLKTLTQALAELKARLSNPNAPDTELVITCIPARPERIHRLGHLISQLAAAYGDSPRIGTTLLKFDSGVLAYRPGVRSQSREKLNREDRFANVRDHLNVANAASVRGRRYLVIDDVSTTGATLLYAKKYLTEAGAASVDCFTIAMNISDPLGQQ
jgi:HAD superfamily hydrolase (TIGR01549 family)